MSTSDQPDTPPLTRRQLREIRNTGATPVITPDAQAPQEEPAPAPVPAAPLPRRYQPDNACGITPAAEPVGHPDPAQPSPAETPAVAGVLP